MSLAFTKELRVMTVGGKNGTYVITHILMQMYFASVCQMCWPKLSQDLVEFHYSVPPFYLSSCLLRLLIQSPSIPPPPHISCFWTSLCFTFPFYFAFSPPCSIFVPPTPTLIYAWFSLPWHNPLRYLYVLNLMYVPQSEIDCPSNSSSEPLNLHLPLA